MIRTAHNRESIHNRNRTHEANYLQSEYRKSILKNKN